MLEDGNVENVRDRLVALKNHRESHVAESAMARMIKIIQASEDGKLISALV